MSSPSSNTSTNKRKADALGDPDPAVSRSGDGGRPAVIARLKDATSVSDPSPTTTPHIPPPVWGRVLDFMPYEEVRSALLVGKIIADEAVKYVRTLNFMKSCQLDGPSVRRFASVEEVNCLCLISGQWNRTVLCRDTTLRLVSLLAIFAKLKRIRVGGLVTDDDGLVADDEFRFYHPKTCSSPENHMDLVKRLCHSFLGAFKARMLPQALHAKGDIAELFFYSDSCPGDLTGDMCTTCRDMCSCFPLQEIVLHSDFCCCVNEFDLFETIAKRKGSREAFRDCSGVRLSDILYNCLVDHILGITESKEEEALRRRLADRGVRHEWPHVRFLGASALVNLDRMIAVGFDPRAVSREELYENLNIGADDRDDDIFAKSTFDALVARGFVLDEADLIVLDERMEPELKDLSARMLGDS